MSADQTIQIAGALLILTAFLFSQQNVLDARSYAYLLLNFVGAAILAVLAYQQQRWGFVLLEGAWTFVALVGVGLRLLGREPTHH
ncbi:MAG: CBU_0592 family membrane protein [Thermomicrobiales bacterium]